MRIAIISDIHGNKLALDAVYSDAKSHKVDTFWCLGDVVGYGPWPMHCWLMIKKINPSVWLPGNHELGLVRENSSYCQGDAKIIIDKQRILLKRTFPKIFEEIELLAENFVAEPLEGVFLAHGMYDAVKIFDSITTYVDNIINKQNLAEQAYNNVQKENKNPKIFVAGHTHKPIFWRRIYDDDRKRNSWVKSEPKGDILLSNYGITPIFLNPGSVGQPRDGNLSASYCILEITENNGYVKFRRVPYPVEQTRLTMKELGYPKSLIDQWYFGSQKE